MALSLTIDPTTFSIGDTVRVHYKIIEKEIVAGKTKKEKHEEQKERTQVFEGIVLAIKNSGSNQTFTVRHVGVGAIGVERIFPVISPWIKKVQIKKKGDVRRAKLYYLRNKKGREAVNISKKEGVVKEVETPARPATPTLTHVAQPQPTQG